MFIGLSMIQLSGSGCSTSPTVPEPLLKWQLAIGRPGIARTVASDALPRLPDGGARGRAKEINGMALFAQGRDAEAADVLVDAAAALAEDPQSAADALLAALRAAAWAGSSKIREIASTAVAPPRPAGPAPQVTDLLVAGYQARYTKGYAAAVPPWRRRHQARARKSHYRRRRERDQ
jgi:hypothetical protein